MAEMTFRAKVDRLDEVLAFVDAEATKLGCQLRCQMQIDVAVEELFVNIAKYAYTPGEGDVSIRIDPVKEGGALEITFIDQGIPYDPLAKPDPDVTLSAEERQIGGLGIFMVKKSMDDMRYEYRDGQNILTIMKRIRSN